MRRPPPDTAVVTEAPAPVAALAAERGERAPALVLGLGAESTPVSGAGVEVGATSDDAGADLVVGGAEPTLLLLWLWLDATATATVDDTDNALE